MHIALRTNTENRCPSQCEFDCRRAYARNKKTCTPIDQVEREHVWGFYIDLTSITFLLNTVL